MGTPNIKLGKYITPNIKLGKYITPNIKLGAFGNGYATTDCIYVDVDDIRQLAPGR